MGRLGSSVRDLDDRFYVVRRFSVALSTEPLYPRFRASPIKNTSYPKASLLMRLLLPFLLPLSLSACTEPLRDGEKQPAEERTHLDDSGPTAVGDAGDADDFSTRSFDASSSTAMTADTAETSTNGLPDMDAGETMDAAFAGVTIDRVSDAQSSVSSDTHTTVLEPDAATPAVDAANARPSNSVVAVRVRAASTRPVKRRSSCVLLRVRRRRSIGATMITIAFQDWFAIKICARPHVALTRTAAMSRTCALSYARKR